MTDHTPPRFGNRTSRPQSLHRGTTFVVSTTQDIELSEEQLKAIQSAQTTMSYIKARIDLLCAPELNLNPWNNDTHKAQTQITYATLRDVLDRIAKPDSEEDKKAATIELINSGYNLVNTLNTQLSSVRDTISSTTPLISDGVTKERAEELQKLWKEFSSPKRARIPDCGNILFGNLYNANLIPVNGKPSFAEKEDAKAGKKPFGFGKYI